jgi:hypothetical protein
VPLPELVQVEMDGRGYFIIEEARYNLSKGKLRISKMQVMT